MEGEASLSVFGVLVRSGDGGSVGFWTRKSVHWVPAEVNWAYVPPPSAAEERLVLSLKTLRLALTCPSKVQKEFVRLCLSGRYAAASAVLAQAAPPEFPLYISGYGLALYSCLAQSCVAEVRRGSEFLIAKLATGAEKMWLQAAAADVRSNNFVGTLVLVAIQHEVFCSLHDGAAEEDGAALDGHLLASRMLFAEARDHLSAGAGEAWLAAPLPSQDTFVSVLVSCLYGSPVLAAAIRLSLKTLHGSDCAFRVLYVPAGSPPDLEHEVPDWAYSVAFGLAEVKADVAPEPSGAFFVFAWDHDVAVAVTSVVQNAMICLGVPNDVDPVQFRVPPPIDEE